jgi:hypothetical protein
MGWVSDGHSEALHVGVNEATGEILAAVASTNDVSDDEVFADILDGIADEIKQV